MKKVFKRGFVLTLFLCTILLCILCSCSANSGNSKILGRWERVEDSKGFDYLEFFSNGYYSSSHSNYEGNYSIDGDRILLQGDLVDSKTYTFEISGNKMEFYDNDGDLYSTYSKK